MSSKAETWRGGGREEEFDTMQGRLLIMEFPLLLHRYRSLRLQATESLKATLSEVDVAVDLSWLENTRAASTRRKDSRVQDFLRQMQLNRSKKLKHNNLDEATIPTAENERAGVQAEGAASTTFSRPLESSSTPQSSDVPLVDLTLVPTRAMLTVGIFNVSCCADRVEAEEAVSQTREFCTIQRGSKFEISGRGRRLSGTISPGTGSVDNGEVRRTAGGNALTLSWANRMGDGNSASLSDRAKSAMMSITTASDVEPVEKTVASADASAFLGEIRFSSRRKEPIHGNETKDMVEDSVSGLMGETQSPCLVVSGVSFVTTDAVQWLGLTTVETLRKPPPMSSPLTEDMEDLPTAGGTGRGCEPSEQTRLAAGTPSLPPRLDTSVSSTSNFHLKVPEVQCRVEAVQGSLDADMSDWFSLRGYWETQDSMAETRRAESIITGDEPSTIAQIPVLRQ